MTSFPCQPPPTNQRTSPFRTTCGLFILRVNVKSVRTWLVAVYIRNYYQIPILNVIVCAIYRFYSFNHLDHCIYHHSAANHTLGMLVTPDSNSYVFPPSIIDWNKYSHILTLSCVTNRSWCNSWQWMCVCVCAWKPIPHFVSLDCVESWCVLFLFYDAEKLFDPKTVDKIGTVILSYKVLLISKWAQESE